RSGSMPKAAPPAKASPLSFNRTRWYRGMMFAGLLCDGFAGAFGAFFLGCSFDGGNIAHLEADEARDRHVLAELGDLGLDELLDRQSGFLDERLFEEADLFVELGEAAFDDAVDDLLGLAFVQGAGAGDFALLIKDIGRNVFAAEVSRIGRGDVHRNVVD